MNKYQSHKATIVSNQQLSTDTYLLTIRSGWCCCGQKNIFQSGQFILLGLPGLGEAAFSLCSASDSHYLWQVAIRKVGNLTKALVQLQKGQSVFWRGPFGRGWPLAKLKGQDLLLIGGGCGFIPLRGLLAEKKIKSYPGHIKIFYGCKNQQSVLFKNEQKLWVGEKKSFQFITEQDEPQGLITDLLKITKVQGDSLAFIVGPPVMIRNTVQVLVNQGLSLANIFFSLERKMCCGLGVCQHCAINKIYVCQEGPIFSGADWQNNPHLI